MITRCRSALVAASVRLGIIRRPDATRRGVQSATLQARLEATHIALQRLTDQNRELQARLDERVTRGELRQLVDAAMAKLESGLDERFGRQARSVEALRTMVGQTDELLERVLEGLEATEEDDENPTDAKWSLAAVKP